MKITFVGSGHGVPEPNRQCACALIETGKRYYFVDMGCSGIQALRDRGIPVEAVEGIFITHMHGDHTNGLIQFVDLITWYFKQADPVICLPDMDAVRVFGDWLRVAQNTASRELRYREVLPGVVFDDGALKVTAIPTEHCIKSYAYLLEAEGRRVLFAGDLRNPKVDFPYVDGELDLAVLECAHFPASDYGTALEKQAVEQLYFHHYTNGNLPSVLELKKALPLKLVTDGLEVKL